VADVLTTEKVAPSKGTRPEGATSEADASRKVREMFTQIAPRYDLLNHLLSLQLDRVWRARTARKLKSILDRPGAVVLDLCCGTGDMAFALHRQAGQSSPTILGADFSHAMLQRARSKSATTGLRWVEADALRLPFPDGKFDLVTTAFGFRNLVNYDAGLREIMRVLRPGGLLYISDLLVSDDLRNRERYQRDAERYARYGVFELPEGVVVRHHRKEWIEELTRAFLQIEYEPFTVTTMNGNPSSAFEYLGRKAEMSAV